MINTKLTCTPSMTDAHGCLVSEIPAPVRLSPGFDTRAAAALAAFAARDVCDDTCPAAPTLSTGETMPEEESARMVVLAEEPRRRGPSTLLREPPSSPAEVRSEEELRRYSVDALRKMAKTCGLDVERGAGRGRLIADLSSFMTSRTWPEETSAPQCAA